jgi:tetratricopeptide (TPR) repeat protein
MIPQDQLASFLDNALDAGQRAALEKELEQDAKALRFVIEQRNLDRALRSRLGSAAHRERLKESILASVAGSSGKQLQAQVLADTSGRVMRPAGGDFPTPGWLHPFQTWISNILQYFQSPKVAWCAFASAILFLAVGTWLLFRPTPAARIVVGQFAAVVGEPTLQQGAGRSTLNAQRSTPVHLGDRLETGDADKAEIVFKDGTTLRLGFNTTLEIPNPKSEIRNPKSPPSRPPEINLLRGQVWTKVQKMTNAPQYAIRTEAATAVARGTEFGVALKRPSTLNPQPSTPTTVLTVKEGAVDFSNALGSVQATAMTESTATPDTAPSQPVVLKTIKTFDVAPGKQLTIEAQANVFDMDEYMFRMVYPQGWAGIYVRSISDEKDTTFRQLRIVRVWPGSPAEQAGLAVGDVITQVNGQPVTKVQEVLRPIFQHQGSSVALSLSREGLSTTVSLVTTNHPYTVPISDMTPDLNRDLIAATWPLIEAGCQEVISRNQWRELEQQFRNMLDRYPGAAAVHNNLGVWYEMNQEVGPAIQQLQQAIDGEPNNPLYHFNLSRVLASIGNFERCAEEAEAVVKLVPDWVPGIIQVAEAYAFLARPDVALTALERSLVANPACPDLWNAKAFGLLNSQRQDEAFVAALKTIELEPSYALWWKRLATFYWSRGDLSEAEGASRKAIELDQGDPEAYETLAVLLINQLSNRLPEDPTDAQPEELAIELWRDRPADERAIIAEAERMARKAITLRSYFASAHVNLGNILLLRGAVDEAEPILRKAAELDPNGHAANAYNNLAYRFAVWGIRLDEALQLAQKAFQLAPSGYTSDTLAMVHFQRGEWDLAEAAWKKCIELGGPQGDPGAWYHLGRLHERQNRLDAAVAAYQEALRLRPDYPEVSRALDNLRR